MDLPVPGFDTWATFNSSSIKYFWSTESQQFFNTKASITAPALSFSRADVCIERTYCKQIYSNEILFEEKFDNLTFYSFTTYNHHIRCMSVHFSWVQFDDFYKQLK